ncbi:hypothetical protein RDE2_19240 [Rhodococcus sp. RDE2]|nr:hypothetical protein RDE2_19240 [Rhodococcus sp. RDE2]
MTATLWGGEGGKAADNARAAASLLRTTATTRDDPVPPCVSRPHLFDHHEPGAALVDEMPRLLEAERLCLQCPLLASCEVLADGFRSVAAGRMYGFPRVADGTPPSSIRFPVSKRKAVA